FNLMVVGQQGLGKSTFVNTLFQAHILDKGCLKTTNIEKTYVLLEEENVSLKLCIIDTPGFGDYSDNSFSWVPICEYIDSNFTQFMFNEEQPFRNLQVDARVHCCLYFISPSNKGLSPLDIVSMQEISKRVNLIPVIAKSDGLTLDELSNFKLQIKEIISKQDIKICDLLLKDQEKLGVSVDYPFAIIGGTYHPEKKKFGREYKHGFVDVMEEKYSDFTKISNFIIKENMIDLIHSTNLYYEIWRDKLLAFRFKKIADLLANIGENNGKTLSELNLEDDIDSNGLDNYKVYSIINKMYLDRHMLDWDPIFIHKQWDLKKSFNDLVSTQEKKFKEWKRTLFNKQNKFNDEIDVLHSRVKMLQKECLKIE
ncbi:Septin, partial [Hanseniaspora valbyensis NRRL Y-1626]